MSDVIDRPLDRPLDRPPLGHNHPPAEPDPPDFARLAEQLTPDILTELLELRFGEYLTRRDTLMEGMYRFAAGCCDPSFLTTVDALPVEGRDGEVVYLRVPGQATGTFHRHRMGKWWTLSDEQVIRTVLPLVEIPDEDVSRKAVSFVRQLKESIKAADHDRGAVKGVFDTAGKVVQGYFRQRVIDPLDAAAKGIEGALSAYQTRLEATRRAARIAEARRLQEEADSTAAAAVRTEHPKVIDAAVDAARAAERGEARASASTADLARVSGDEGGVAAAREVWTFTVTDPDAVPREYLMIDTAKIRDMVRRDKAKAIGAIPGVEVKREIRASVR